MSKYNDYVINAGNGWKNLEPIKSAKTKQKAVESAKKLKYKCLEVVYSPCDELETDEIVWRN